MKLEHGKEKKAQGVCRKAGQALRDWKEFSTNLYTTRERYVKPGMVQGCNAVSWKAEAGK